MIEGNGNPCLYWEIPRTEASSVLQFMGLQELHMTWWPSHHLHNSYKNHILFNSFQSQNYSSLIISLHHHDHIKKIMWVCIHATQTPFTQTVNTLENYILLHFWSFQIYCFNKLPLICWYSLSKMPYKTVFLTELSKFLLFNVSHIFVSSLNLFFYPIW